MNIQKFTGYWNKARFVVIIGAFVLFVCLQILAVGSGFAPNLEVEYVPDIGSTDYGKQQEACEASKGSDSATFSTDENGAQHMYKDGCEVS